MNLPPRSREPKSCLAELDQRPDTAPEAGTILLFVYFISQVLQGASQSGWASAGAHKQVVFIARLTIRPLHMFLVQSPALPVKGSQVETGVKYPSKLWSV